VGIGKEESEATDWCLGFHHARRRKVTQTGACACLRPLDPARIWPYMSWTLLEAEQVEKERLDLTAGVKSGMRIYCAEVNERPGLMCPSQIACMRE
jgi:hypothetical protein